MSELKPCPFCGEKDSVELIDNEEYFFVICNLLKRGCGASSFKTDEDTEQVVKAWNTRARSRPMTNDLLRLARAAQKKELEIMLDVNSKALPEYSLEYLALSKACTPQAIINLCERVEVLEKAEKEQLSLDITNATKIADLLREQLHWIPVSERLPPDCSSYAIRSIQLIVNDGFVTIGYWYPETETWHDTSVRGITKQVTHWMPLPEPPEK